MTDPPASASRPGNYATQAQTYDRTRRASPALVDVLLRELGPPDGRRVVDVAGGTGNYAAALQEAGFEVVVADAEVAMLERAARKVGAVVGADAATMPFRDGSFDAAVLVSALHLFDDPRAAIREIRRVITGGPFVLHAFALENLGHAFVFEYFVGSDPRPGMHPPVAELGSWLREAGFTSVVARPFAYPDTADACLHALHTDAEKLVDTDYLMNNSFFQRLPEETRATGLARLREDLREGVLQARVERSIQIARESGHATVFTALP